MPGRSAAAPLRPLGTAAIGGNLVIRSPGTVVEAERFIVIHSDAHAYIPAVAVPPTSDGTTRRQQNETADHHSADKAAFESGSRHKFALITPPHGLRDRE
jgi:hypothetical protein